MSMNTEIELKVGDRVKAVGQKGVFTIKSFCITQGFWHLNLDDGRKVVCVKLRECKRAT